MIEPPACRTCQHWDQRFPQNSRLGVCRRMGALIIGDEVAILVTTNPTPTSDVSAVRTGAMFGCRLHSDYRIMQLSGTL